MPRRTAYLLGVGSMQSAAKLQELLRELSPLDFRKRSNHAAWRAFFDRAPGTVGAGGLANTGVARRVRRDRGRRAAGRRREVEGARALHQNGGRARRRGRSEGRGQRAARDAVDHLLGRAGGAAEAVASPPSVASTAPGRALRERCGRRLENRSQYQTKSQIFRVHFFTLIGRL